MSNKIAELIPINDGAVFVFGKTIGSEALQTIIRSTHSSPLVVDIMSLVTKPKHRNRFQKDSIRSHADVADLQRTPQQMQNQIMSFAPSYRDACGKRKSIPSRHDDKQDLQTP